MNEKNEKKGKGRTFGVGVPSFKFQPTYGKEGKGSTIPTKEIRSQQFEKNRGNIVRRTTSWWVSMYLNCENKKVITQKKIEIIAAR